MLASLEVELPPASLGTSQSQAGVPVGRSENVSSVPESAPSPGTTQPVSYLGMWLRTLTPRQMVGMAVVPIIIIVTIVTESRTNLKPEQHRLLGVLCLVSVLYLSEAAPLPVTGLLIGPMICAFRACADGTKCEDKVLPPYFKDVIFLLLGSNFLATSMQLHGSDKRLTQWMTNLSCVRGSPLFLRYVLTFMALFMACVLSGPAMMSIFLPILMTLSGAETGHMLADPNAEEMLKGNILCVLYAILAGCMSTTLSPSVVVARDAIEKAGGKIGFLQYMLVGVPGAVLVTLQGLAVTHGTMPSNVAQRRSSLARTSLQQTCSVQWAWGEKVTCFSWAVALLLWVLPSLTNDAIQLSPGAAVMLASVPVFLVPDVDKDCRKPVLPWDAAMKGGGWSSLFLAGGGLSLGTALMTTGLAKLIAQKFLWLTGIKGIFALTAVTCFMTTFTTEFLANMAAINLFTPIVLNMGLVIAKEQNCEKPENMAMIPALIVPMAASCSFMMPWASPMNSAAYDSGHVPVGQMMKYGFVMNILSGLILVLINSILVPLVWPYGQCTSNIM